MEPRVGEDSRAEPEVSLYRAVSLAEAADIQRLGGVRSRPRELGTYEGKLFAATIEGVEYWADVLYRGRSEPFRIVELRVPERFAGSLFQFLADGGHLALHVDADQFDELNADVQWRIIGEGQ